MIKKDTRYIAIWICAILSSFCSNDLWSQIYHEDRHNTSVDASWISCQPTASPNPARGVSHWIMYDLGNLYQLGPSHFWNLNAPDFLTSGISELNIDLSEDGVNWVHAANYNLIQALGSGFYIGESGPNLSGRNARYILITVTDNHGGPCSGFSEWKVAVSEAADPSLCETEFMDISTNPGVDSVIVQSFITSNWIIDPIQSPGHIVFQAGDSITLTPGFHARPGVSFHAYILPCEPVQDTQNLAENDTINLAASMHFKTESGDIGLMVMPNVSSTSTTIEVVNSEQQSIKLLVFNHSGQLVQNFLNSPSLLPGTHHFNLPLETFAPGLYYIQLITPADMRTQRLVVVKH